MSAAGTWAEGCGEAWRARMAFALDLHLGAARGGGDGNLDGPKQLL